MKQSPLTTVCEEALCPNRTDCWSRGTVTFQILGSICTRRCTFCAETTGRPLRPDPQEPAHLLQAVRDLRLRHVVLTSPARDDLADQGSGAFASCIRTLRNGEPGVTIEALIPDMQGRPGPLHTVFSAAPDILNHNVETVRRLNPEVRPRADYDRSLTVLKKAGRSGLRTKSGVMVGLGERKEELEATFQDISRSGVSILTVGQYLPPGPDHRPIDRFYMEEEFTELKEIAKDLFETIVIGPLVRSSYHAEEALSPIPQP